MRCKKADDDFTSRALSDCSMLRVSSFLPLILAFCWACDDDASSKAEKACNRLDQAWSLPKPAPNCSKRSTPRDLSAKNKLSVAVYHFNVQYVAGGVRGFPDGEIIPQYDLDEKQTEDRIVTEGLEPVLDLYLANPTFHADIELQAYMVEIIQERHPEVLKKMLQLADSGQVDFDSFHYSDQLYVAYPRLDMERSLDLTEQVFESACLPLGLSIFTQEGQYAPGQLSLAKARGYPVSILPKNLFVHQYGEQGLKDGILFQDPDISEHTVLIGGRSFTYEDINGKPFELRWRFMDDGEIAFSKDELNPYFGLDYVLDPELIARHAEELKQLESEGYVFATVAEAVKAMKAQGVPTRALPNLLDGTWQPKNTQNVYRWMGGPGVLRPQENDGEVLAALWRARTRIAQAESVISDPSKLTAAWREILLGQVSDSTGWNPFAGEISYSFEHANLAEDLVSDAFTCLGEEEPEMTPWTCTKGDEVNFEDLGVTFISDNSDDPALNGRFTAVAHRCLNNDKVHVLEVTGSKTTDQELILFDDPPELAKERDIQVGFTRTSSIHRWVMALEDEFRTVDTSAMVFDWTGVPLPYGVISLSDKDFVVQDNASGRTAVLFTNKGQHTDKLRFYDKTVSRKSDVLRRWYILTDISDERALQLARDINLP
ncbi:MAG: hypothetical protein VYC39_05470 [Myxococcota bacterium]|nr:hypothetical protein [Myxococcota bacterium]